MPAQYKVTDLIEYVGALHASLNQADWLWERLIQNPLFQQLYGGGRVPIEDSYATPVALAFTEQFKIVADQVNKAAAGIEGVLRSALPPK